MAANDRAERVETPTLPFISVIVPVRNGAGRLEICLDSLARQTYPADRFEVIVADGMSTDDTAAIAERFGARVVTNAEMHLVGGRNVGVENVRGELFCFTEDDMELPPD